MSDHVRSPTGRRVGAQCGPREQNQESLPPSPPLTAYKPGFCANGHTGEVAPTQLELGGPPYPICRKCNTEAAEYRDDVRGYAPSDDDEHQGDFRRAVTKAFNRVVHPEVRGPKWFYAPRHRGEGVR